MRNWRYVRENRDGFTLVEVLAVLVIIAILAAVAIPTMSGFISDARKKSYTSQARNVYVAAQAAALELETSKDGTAAASVTVYTRKDGSKYMDRVEAFLGNDVENGSHFTITLDGNKVEEVEYTPENGKKITITGLFNRFYCIFRTGGEGVTYEE